MKNGIHKLDARPLKGVFCLRKCFINQDQTPLQSRGTFLGRRSHMGARNPLQGLPSPPTSVWQQPPQKYEHNHHNIQRTQSIKKIYKIYEKRACHWLWMLLQKCNFAAECGKLKRVVWGGRPGGNEREKCLSVTHFPHHFGHPGKKHGSAAAAAAVSTARALVTGWSPIFFLNY